MEPTTTGRRAAAARAGRGSLVYHRYDGHYGLLVPAGVQH